MHSLYGDHLSNNILQHLCSLANTFVVKKCYCCVGDYMYCNEIIQFERETQKQVAEYLGLSADYILGLPNDLPYPKR